MAAPLIAGLTRAARLALPFIERGVREGLSSRAIERAIRDGGLSAPRRQVLLDTMRALKGVEDAGKALKFLRQDARPDPSRLPEALTTIRRQYSFTVEVRGTLISTGEDFVQHVTVTSDSLLTRAEMEEAAVEAVDQGQERYGIKVSSALPIKGIKAGKGGVF